MKKDIQIGSLVKYIRTGWHHSEIKDYNYQITCHEDELGKSFIVLDKINHHSGTAYKIMCNKGITYLRDRAIELINSNYLFY